MLDVKSGVFLIVTSAILSGCVSAGGLYFDSALNDKNRAPASMSLPSNYNATDTQMNKEKEVESIGSQKNFAFNQAKADYLFLKSELLAEEGHVTETVELLKEALSYDNQSPTLKQKLAIEYYKLGKLDEAVVLAISAYKTSGERRDIGMLLAGLYTTTKDYVAAETIYKKIYTKDKSDAEVALYLGAIYTEQKKYAKAVEVFSEILKNSDYSSKYLVHYYLARVYSEQDKKNWKRVKESLKKSLDAKPDFFEAVSMYAHVLQIEKGPEAAYRFYEDHQIKHGPSLRIAEVLSQYYISTNRFDDAYEQLQLLDEKTEDSVNVKLKMALILLEKKIYDKAIPKLKEILKLAPESDKVRYYLAAVYEEQKNLTAALKEYSLIPEGSSYYEESQIHVAFILKTENEINKATQVLNKLITKDLKTPQAYFLLAQIQDEKKDLPSAILTMKKATQKFPKNAVSFYNLGTFQDRAGQKDEMLETMNNVLTLEKDHAQALNYIAYTWAEKEINLEKALEYARKAALKEKQDPYILDTLGWVLHKIGKTQEAISTLEKAHKMNPELSVISEHLGDIYFHINEYSKAASYFEVAVASESDEIRIKEIKYKLSGVENKLKNSRLPTSVSPNSKLEYSP